jgi:hypothetical protein
VQLCVLAVLVPIFASRDSSDPIRLVIIAFGAFCAITIFVLLGQHDGRAARRSCANRAHVQSRKSNRGFEQLPHRPEFVVELRAATFLEAHVQRAQESVTSRSTGIRRSSDFA